jgi:hypothetical protein
MTLTAVVVTHAWLSNANCMTEMKQFLANADWHKSRRDSSMSREKAVVFLVATAEADKELNTKTKEGKSTKLDDLAASLPNFTKVKMFYGFEQTEKPKMEAVINKFATVHEVGGCTSRMQLTHSLKGAWLQPLSLPLDPS